MNVVKRLINMIIDFINYGLIREIPKLNIKK